MDNIKIVGNFLEKNLLNLDLIDLTKESVAYLREMEGSLTGKNSSLAGIPTFISYDGEVTKNKRVIVIDAGGTNFRVASVSFNNDGVADIHHFKKYRMPGSDGTITYEQFNKAVVDYLEPVLKDSDLFGMCFSYECEILNNRDGRIISLAKEVYIEGAVGKLVCEGINNEIVARGYKSKKYCLINDTVASTLGGIATNGKEKYDGYVGFILGTGTNSCYSESCAAVTKNPDVSSLSGSMLINLESGKYANMPISPIDEALFATTKMPDAFKMEKMTGGAYQGELFLLIVKAAAEQGVFSDNFKKSAAALSGLTAMEIDKFCFNPHEMGTLHGLCSGIDDIERLLLLADSFYERIAKLATLQFAGLLMRTDKGHYKCRPMCVVAEGTTFYKSKFFRPKLDFYVKQFIEGEMGRYIEFISVENATLVGTAAAILLCD